MFGYPPTLSTLIAITKVSCAHPGVELLAVQVVPSSLESVVANVVAKPPSRCTAVLAAADLFFLTVQVY